MNVIARAKPPIQMYMSLTFRRPAQRPTRQRDKCEGRNRLKLAGLPVKLALTSPPKRVCQQKLRRAKKMTPYNAVTKKPYSGTNITLVNYSAYRGWSFLIQRGLRSTSRIDTSYTLSKGVTSRSPYGRYFASTWFSFLAIVLAIIAQKLN